MRLSYFSAALAGLLFALGLAISGMMSPLKVQGFLDLAGHWDPSLSLVMGGAVAVTFVSFPLIFKRKYPIAENKFVLPTATRIDAKLLIGAGLFGVGWAVSGLCPGPALANLGTLNPGVFLYIVGMLAGFVLFQQVSLFNIRSHSKNSLEAQLESEHFKADQCVID